MKIITRLKDLGIEVETDMSKGEAIQLIFEALQDGFQNQADNEAYFSESFLEENFVFGRDAPDKVRLIAHSWNEDIKTNLYAHLRRWAALAWRRKICLWIRQRPTICRKLRGNWTIIGGFMPAMEYT